MGVRGRQLARNGWIPLQHGGWAIIILPTLAGMVVGGWSWSQLALLVAALALFLGFTALEGWQKARKNSRYLPAIGTYGGLAALSGLPVVLFRPELLHWSWVALPFMVAVGVAWWKRGSASAWTRLLLIAASTLLTPAAALVGPRAFDPRAVLLASVIVFLFLVGSLLHVRCLIRGRGDRRWWFASLIFHGLLVLLALSAHLGAVGVGLAVFLLIRAWLLPFLRDRGVRIKPMVIGVVEEVATVAVFVTILVVC